MSYLENREYKKAFDAYCLEGTVTDVLEQGKSQYGYRVYTDWAQELFKNIASQTVVYPEASHRESEISLEYRSTTCYLRVTLDRLKDPQFSLLDEISEFSAEYMAVLFDQASVQFGGQDGVKSLVDAHHHIQSDKNDEVTFEDIEALERSVEGVEDVKWYMNSNTALQVITLRKGEEWLVSPRDAEVLAVGVPAHLHEKEMVYNEYMDGCYNGSNIPIILGNLKKSYVLDMGDAVSIMRSKCKITDRKTNMAVDGIEIEVTFMVAGRVINDTYYSSLQMKA